jgi:hypothetical protein
LKLIDASFTSAGDAAGSVQLIDAGFERAEPACLGQLCLVGGFVP